MNFKFCVSLGECISRAVRTVRFKIDSAETRIIIPGGCAVRCNPTTVLQPCEPTIGTTVGPISSPHVVTIRAPNRDGNCD